MGWSGWDAFQQQYEQAVKVLQLVLHGLTTQASLSLVATDNHDWAASALMHSRSLMGGVPVWQVPSVGPGRLAVAVSASGCELPFLESAGGWRLVGSVDVATSPDGGFLDGLPASGSGLGCRSLAAA